MTVVLEDHYTGDEINAAVNRGGAFADAFPGETGASCDALRALFQRKALLARQGRLLSAEAAIDAGELTARPDADARAAASCAWHRRLRRRAGVRDRRRRAGGRSDVRFWRMASLTALSLEANGGICRDLLQVRYGRPEEVAA